MKELFIVSTPIGNIKDITLRAIDTLKESDCIICEDSRRTKKLFSLLGIELNKKFFTIYKGVEKRRAEAVLNKIAECRKVSFVSDAGTPLVSDPGNYFVREALRRGFEVYPVPGASSVLSALVVSGFDCDHFVFSGFLPQKIGKARKEIELLKELPYTLVFFISPHRAVKEISLLEEFFSDRNSVLIREITKKFEEKTRGKLLEIKNYIEGKKLKGEFVLVIEGKR